MKQHKRENNYQLLFTFSDELWHQLRGFGLGTASDLQELLRDSSFQSFWNRVYLVGPNSVGKSCLAKILVGEQVPQSRKSTDGIWIYMGRAGMDVDGMKWIYFKKGISINECMLLESYKFCVYIFICMWLCNQFEAKRFEFYLDFDFIL